MMNDGSDTPATPATPASDRAAVLEQLRQMMAKPPSTEPPECVRDAPPAALKSELTDEVSLAHNSALRKLTARARSERAIIDHLRQRGFGEPAIAEVVGRLKRVGLIDDAALARQWVDDRRRSKGLGRARLRQELRTQGVDADLVEAALGATAEGDDAVAWDFARRRARALAGLDQPSFERRLAGQLTRRGFAPALVRRVVLGLSAERADGTGQRDV
jgi:regulatory protein